MLGQRRRWWSNIKPALYLCDMSSGKLISHAPLSQYTLKQLAHVTRLSSKWLKLPHKYQLTLLLIVSNGQNDSGGPAEFHDMCASQDWMSLFMIQPHPSN